MKRTFAIYKGKDLSKMGMGYSNVKSARKFMDHEPIIEDFNKLFDDDYWFEHKYVHPLDKTKSTYYPNRWGGFCHSELSIPYHEDFRTTIYLPNLPEDVKEIAIEYCKLYKEWWNHYEHDNERDREVAIRLDELSIALTEKGYGPHIYKDEKDYKKKLSKFITDNVEFVEKEVEITVK